VATRRGDVHRSVRLFAAAVLLCTACGTEGLSSVEDERVEIVAPEDRAAVSLPVTVSWTVRDFAVTGPTGAAQPDAGYFGVFLDRAPQPPGETFRWFAKDDRQCEITPGCPDQAYFASKDVYSTTQTTFTIDKLPEVRPERERKFRDLHEVIVVLLNAKGERIGESAFSVEFELKRAPL
jgi:hypothetical protein